MALLAAAAAIATTLGTPPILARPLIATIAISRDAATMTIATAKMIFVTVTAATRNAIFIVADRIAAMAAFARAAVAMLPLPLSLTLTETGTA